MTAAGTEDPQQSRLTGPLSSVAAIAVAALQSAGSNPIIKCFPQGAVIAFDRELRYLCAGGLGLADVGLSREMLEGNTIFEVYSPEVVAVIEPLYRLALAGEESSFDVPYKGRIYLQRLGPLRADDGEIVAGVGFTQDVTEARRGELELHESELRFRLAFEHAPIAKALIGLDGRYELVNPAMCAFTGYSADELVGLTFADITDPADLPADLAAMAGLLADERTSYSMDKRYRTADGAIVWGVKSATLVRHKDGSPLHFIVQILDITARKMNEQALADERRRLRDAESIGRVGSWELNLVAEPDTEAISWSDGMFELWGIEPTKFDGNYDAARRQIEPADLPLLDAAVAQCTTVGTPFRVRYRITRLGDKSQRWIDARGAATRNGGRVVRIGGALADVTDMVVADAAAAATQAFQQAVFTASPDVITVWDFDSGSDVWTNRSFPELLGYDQQDIAKIDIARASAVFPADLDRFEAALSTSRDATTDDVVQVDYRMVQKGGAIRWFSQRSAPISRGADGKVAQIVEIIRDTTDGKLAEAALQESESRFRQLAENVNVGFVLRNLDPPAVLYVSPGYEKIIGYDPMAVGGSPLTALRRVIHPADWEQVQANYWSKVGAGLPAEGEFRILRPDGEVRWVRATSSPVTDQDGVIRRTASTGEDITERKVAQAAQLLAENHARANAVKSEFLSRMSHELRTPLNAVLGFGQLLELDDLSGSQQDSVQHILRGGRILVGLVDDMLDITEIHGGQLGLMVQPLGADALLRECLLQVAPEAAARGITLHFAPGTDDVTVNADHRRLSQVVVNLLSNAIKYNRPAGRVDVSYTVSGGAVEIIVSDTGTGISDQDLPRLFVPFDRIDAAAREIEGSGLGLTLSRDLITAMGGTLDAASEEGVGSTFTASIPLAG